LKYANRAKQIKTVVKRNVLNVEYHISNYRNIINNLRSEISNLKSQLTEAKKGSSIKLQDSQDNPFLPEISPSGTPKLESNHLKSSALKKKQLDLNVHFEKEAIHKKKILE
jgi:kinesin family protein 18/19